MNHETHRYTLTLDGQPPEDLGELSTDATLTIVRQRVEQSGRRVTWGRAWHPTGTDGVDYLLIFSRQDDASPVYCGIIHRKK